MKVVVVGSGIGGVSAAYHLLEKGHDVVLLEKNEEIGGHAYKIALEDGETVDLGFMMYGDSNPNIKNWFNKVLNITKPDGTSNIRIPMSMSVSSDVKSDLQFSSRSPFNSIGDLFSSDMWTILIDIYKFTVDLVFNQHIVKEKVTTREWSLSSNYSPLFFRHYFIPFVSILWTIPKKDVMDLPVTQFLRCLQTHANSLYIPLWQVVMGALGRRVDRPKQLWWYIGTKYHEPFMKYFNAKGGKRAVLKCNSGVKSVAKGGRSVTLDNGETIECDKVVLAAHADETVKMLPWLDEEAKQTMMKYHFHNSMMYVHSDPSFLPDKKKAWSSWNVRITEDDEYILTYWMNRIQRLKCKRDIFVTITAKDFKGKTPKPESIIKQFPWDHPRLLADCIPQADILNEEGLVLSGAWLGRGFHEDGFVAGRLAACIIDNPEVHSHTVLYEDPDNIPVPPVPAFGMPVGVKVFFASSAVAAISSIGFACYKFFSQTNSWIALILSYDV